MVNSPLLRVFLEFILLKNTLFMVNIFCCHSEGRMTEESQTSINFFLNLRYENVRDT